MLRFVSTSPNRLQVQGAQYTAAFLVAHPVLDVQHRLSPSGASSRHKRKVQPTHISSFRATVWDLSDPIVRNRRLSGNGRLFHNESDRPPISANGLGVTSATAAFSATMSPGSWACSARPIGGNLRHLVLRSRQPAALADVVAGSELSASFRQNQPADLR